MSKSHVVSVSKYVVVEKSGTKQWIIERCDLDPELVGTVASCGLPSRAKDLPIGSTFETKFTIKNKMK